MNKLKSLLLLTPSLVHLKLIGGVNINDTILNGSRWEEFLQAELPLLEKFEFFFRVKLGHNRNSGDTESFIRPFQTIFWLENKSCFVTWDSVTNAATFRLYSIPICNSYIIYESDFDKVSCSTLITINNEAKLMENVREIHLDLTQMMKSVIKEKVYNCY
jgi:hypothetical protein